MRTPTVGLGLALVALGASGCATNLSMLQTGKTLDPGRVRVQAGAGLYVPAGQAAGLIGTGTGFAKRATEAVAGSQPFQWTKEDEETLFTTALALAALPPAPVFELNARVGLVKNLDLGFRYSTNAVRLDAKYRFFSRGDEASGASTDVAVNAGVSKYLFKNPVVDLLGYVKMDDFSRWDVEASVPVSRDFNPYVGVYGGPRYLYSHTTMDETLVKLTGSAATLLQDYGTFTVPDVRMPAKVDMHFVGATVGLRAGPPVVSVYLEVTLGYTFAGARVLGADRQLGGFTAYPAGGLAVAF